MAILIHKLRLLYIRVPKTGSTSFVNGLDDQEPEHIGDVHGGVVEAEHLLRGRHEWLSYRRVGFIRNPYEWVQSAYAHWRISPDSFPTVQAASGLYQFVWRLPSTPITWLCDADGKLMCEVWRTEDMTTICARLGIREFRKNGRLREPMEMNDETRALICRKFAREFRIGGYDA